MMHVQRGHEYEPMTGNSVDSRVETLFTGDMTTTTCPDCRVICGSLLEIVTDDTTRQVVMVTPFSCIDDLLYSIANQITHPEEDVAVSAEIVSDEWEEHVKADLNTNEFTFSRSTGPAKGLTFSVFLLADVGRRTWQ